MRDSVEPLLIAFLGFVGIELIDGWTEVALTVFTCSIIVFRIIMGIKKNKRDIDEARRAEEEARRAEEKRAEEHEKHLLEMDILRKQLNNEV